jgi:single-strand DNA-binding protein
MEITGRITDGAQVKTLPDERKVVSFSIAINDSYKPKGGEEKKYVTYFNCSYWLGTGIAPHLTKGSIVTLWGRADINSYKNREGDFFAHLVFHCNNIKIVSKMKNGSAQAAELEEAGAEADKTDLPF